MKRLSIELNKNSEEKYYIQLYEDIKSEILLGNLQRGDKLPSIRQSSIKFKISMTTVLQAYSLLEKYGYIEKIPGKGCFVKGIENFTLEKKVLPLLNTFKYGQYLESSAINFSNGTPPSKYFPLEIYKKLSKDILEKYGASVFEYQNVQGVQSLREVLSEYLEKEDIFVTENEILITSGTQQCLEIVLKLFSENLELTVLVSDPTYPNALNIFQGNCNIRTIELEEDGWNMERLEEILKHEKIDLVYEVINFHNPTGVVWSDEKRKKLLHLAKKYNFYVVEDDSFSEFFYTGEKPKPLKSLDRINSERVIYIRTFSKTIMPGIGIALMIIPPLLQEKGILAKYGIDTTTSGLNQRILEEFIRENYFPEHISKIKNILKVKYEHMFKILENSKNLKIVTKPRGGFFFWVRILKDINIENFYGKAIEEGISLLPGSIFYNSGKMVPIIRLSFTVPTLTEIEKGIKKIDNLIDEF